MIRTIGVVLLSVALAIGYCVFYRMRLRIRRQQQDLQDFASRNLMLSRQADYFRLLAENVQDVIYRYRFLPTPAFEYVSPAATSLNGYTPDEHYADPLLWQALLPDEDRSLIETLFKQSPALLAGPLLLRWKTKAGKICWIEQSNRLIYDGQQQLVAMEGLVRDITRRKLTEEEMKSHAIQQAILAELGQDALVGAEIDRLLQDTVIIVAQTLELDSCRIFELFTDQKTLRLRAGYGCENQEIGVFSVQIDDVPSAKAIFASHQPTATADCGHEHPSCAASDQNACISGVGVMISGKAQPFGILYAESRKQRLFTQGDTHFLQSIANTLSAAVARQKDEDELREINRLLKEALAEIELSQQQLIQKERLNALGRMASGIAHDFNNSLMPIMGFSDLLLTRPTTLDNREKTLRYIQMINTAAKDASKVVMRMREFYRPREEGEIFEATDINQLIEQSINMTQPRWKEEAQAAGKKIAIVTHLTEVPRLPGLEAELREALVNLILNAADAINEEGTITVSSGVDGRFVTIEICDSGVGMTEEVKRHVFEPFYTTKGEHGTGLGLAMVYGCIRRHEGTVHLESEPGKGTAFIIRLPFDKTERIDTNIQTIRPPMKPCHILVVDDEPAVRQVITEFVSYWDHTFEVAANGQEGLEKFRAGKFDLVITDWSMPQMSGDQMAEAIKQIAPGQPIVLLTGFGVLKQSSEKPAAVDFMISKPATLEKLYDVISKAIS